MMKTRGSSRLTSKERKELMVELCRGLAALNTPEEIAEALLDLLSPKEVETIAKRLKIAEYLSEGKEYQYIRKTLKVGFSTIARVNTWLNLSGDGFKTMFSRKKKPPKEASIEEKYDPYSWYNIKRRYSTHFWPDILLEELPKIKDKKEREKIESTLKSLDSKQMSREENKQLFQSFSTKFTFGKSNEDQE